MCFLLSFFFLFCLWQCDPEKGKWSRKRLGCLVTAVYPECKTETHLVTCRRENTLEILIAVHSIDGWTNAGHMGRTDWPHYVGSDLNSPLLCPCDSVLIEHLGHMEHIGHLWTTFMSCEHRCLFHSEPVKLQSWLEQVVSTESFISQRLWGTRLKCIAVSSRLIWAPSSPHRWWRRHSSAWLYITVHMK